MQGRGFLVRPGGLRLERDGPQQAAVGQDVPPQRRVPLGQEEAAYSVGLNWWKVQVFIVLPQALRIVVPGIVNNIVDLFKDTSLVTTIGLIDLLAAVNLSIKDPQWLGFAMEGYIFTAVVFFICCFAMSSYGRRFERRLNRHRHGAH